ncbi:MAG: vitellogenin precursor [Segetibacter sp.]|nr:vitellogenin precursor [Segetibacter sp.]
MKAQTLLLVLAVMVLGSCSTAYKASQTPDDVYYSPARAVETAKTEKKKDKYEDYYTSEDDRYLRMKVNNRSRWSAIDDYDYWYDSRYRPYYTYNYYRDINLGNNWYPGYYPNRNFGFGYNNYGYQYGNSFYSRRGYGTNTYGGNYITKYPYKSSSSVGRPSLQSYRNSNNFGNTVKRVFSTENNSSYNNGNNNNSNNSSYNNSNSRTTTSESAPPSRSYTPSSSSSSSSSSGSSSGGGVSRPARNGN